MRMDTTTPLPLGDPLEGVPSMRPPSRELVRSLRHEAAATLRLALPITSAQVAMMLMGLVDSVLVGHVSDAALAAVSLGNSLGFAVMCPAFGITMAVEPMASQAMGAKEPLRAWSSVRAGVLAVLLSSPLVMLMSLGAVWLLPLAGAEPPVVELSWRYALGRLPGIPFFLVFMASKAFLEASGITRPIMIGSWVANLVNVLLVSLLVFGDRALRFLHLPPLGLPVLGALGVGIGMSVSNVLMLAVALFAVWRARPAGASLLPSWDTETRTQLRQLFRVGLPIGLQVLTEVGAFSTASVIIARFGATASAAHQVALGLCSLTFMVVIGMGAATAVRVGRAVGEGSRSAPARAGFVGIGLTALYSTGCALVFLLARHGLAALFSPSPAVIEQGASFLWVAAAFQVFDGVQGVASGALRGAGDTRAASVFNVLGYWVLGLPLGWLLCFPMHMGPLGIWWGLSAGLAFVAVVLSLRFRAIARRPIRTIASFD